MNYQKFQFLFIYYLKEIDGARISDYVLEQTRVLGQGAQERGFHVFYQVLCKE